MRRKKKRSFVATVTRDGVRWCARILGLRDITVQWASLGETAERLRWLLTARLEADDPTARPAQVEITLVFSPNNPCEDCVC
jgi:orotate phosphoribosyltransferase-like protein